MVESTGPQYLQRTLFYKVKHSKDLMSMRGWGGGVTTGSFISQEGGQGGRTMSPPEE